MYPFLQENLSIAKLVQGGFVFLNIVFGWDNPTYDPPPIQVGGLNLLT